MKKLYYFLALIGIVACSTDSIDVYEGELPEASESYVAEIYFDTEVEDASLDALFISYFGEGYADRSDLYVTLTGTMNTEDFADLKGLTVLDMSGVTLLDEIIPTNAFAYCRLDSLILPMENVLTVQTGAFADTHVEEVLMPASVTTFEDDLFDATDTMLVNLYVNGVDEDAIPTISLTSFPTRFLKSENQDLEEDETEYVVWVPVGTYYFYKQDPIWSQYNLREASAADGTLATSVVVYLDSDPVSLVAELYDEIVAIAGTDYESIEELELTVKGTMIAEDFAALTNASFRKIDLSEVTIIGDILIQSPVSTTDTAIMWDGNAIPEEAFSQNAYLEEIILPSAVEAIGYLSFYQNYALTDITFADGISSLKRLSQASFSQCTALKSPDFVTNSPLETICMYAFGGCTSLESLTIPKSVDSLGTYIVNNSGNCDYIRLLWDENDSIPLAYSSAPPFPSQFYMGDEAFITIPDDTRDQYTASGWGIFNLLELSEVVQPKDWVLKFEDNFDDLNTTLAYWDFESGYIRNYEDQYYTNDNWELTDDGTLLIKAKAEVIPNEYYVEGSSDWTTSTPYTTYTSSSLKVRDAYSFLYGRAQIRAKLPTNTGAWPALTLMGNENSVVWPRCGQINIASYYQSNVVHEVCYAGYQNTESWISTRYPFASSADSLEFADNFHTWLVEWDEEDISIYQYSDDMYDSTLVYTVSLSLTTNVTQGSNPFKTYYHYLKLSLALGSKGGTVDPENLPQMEVDYVKFWQYDWQYYRP